MWGDMNYLFSFKSRTEVISGHFSYRTGLDCTLYYIIYRDPIFPDEQAPNYSGKEKTPF